MWQIGGATFFCIFRFVDSCTEPTWNLANWREIGRIPQTHPGSGQSRTRNESVASVRISFQHFERFAQTVKLRQICCQTMSKPWYKFYDDKSSNLCWDCEPASSSASFEISFTLKAHCEATQPVQVLAFRLLFLV